MASRQVVETTCDTCGAYVRIPLDDISDERQRQHDAHGTDCPGYLALDGYVINPDAPH